MSLKYFIGYNSDIGVVPLCIKFPQMSGYLKYFDNDDTYENINS